MPLRLLALLLLLGSTSACSLIDNLIWGGERVAFGHMLASRPAEPPPPPEPAPRARPVMGPAYGGQYMGVYAQLMFSYAFSNGGLTLATADYRPGEYTRWSIPGDDGEQNTLERARLGDDDRGNQWWKLKMVDGGETIVLEALLSPKEQRILRLRGKFPGDATAKEMPVDENSYYVPPQRLTKESMEGAVVGTVTVKVPAGTFKARHVVFGSMGSGTHEWWLAEKIPGGTVKQALKSTDDDGEQSSYEMLLVAYGSDSVSELGSK